MPCAPQGVKGFDDDGDDDDDKSREDIFHSVIMESATVVAIY